MKKIQIGLPCSPAHIVEHEMIKVTEVLISYGGGMGGASRTYFCTNVQKSDPFYLLTRINTEVKKVNPRFIVEMGDIRIVKVVTDTTAHKNYHGGNHPKTLKTEYFRLRHGEDYEIVDKYVARHDGELQKRIIKLG